MDNPNNELRDYLKILIHRLLYIKGINKQLVLLKEWETPKRIIALEIGAYFFRLVGFSFNRTLLIELYLLVAEREDKSLIDWLIKAKEHSKSLNPTFYKPELGKRIPIVDKEYQDVITNHQTLLQSKKELIDRIKGRRDSVLTHSDAHFFHNPDDIYKKFPINTEEIEELINVITEILRMQYVYLFDADLDIQVHTTSNIDTILWHTRGFRRVWEDKRITDLQPYIYKIDDYEEKLEELKRIKQK